MNNLVEPQYVTSLEEIFWGGTLVAITMAIHGFGMLLVLRVVSMLKNRFAANPSFFKGMLTLILASWMILIVHLSEVVSWASFFFVHQAVDAKHCNASLCYYFALLDYTTLGCPYNLVLRWRLLEGMIAMAGLMTFAWSTGVLLTLAQDFQDQQLQLVKQRHEKRHVQGSPP
jgi:hypothetical protein